MKIAILGSRKGLGFEIARLAAEKAELFLCSRQIHKISKFESFACDFNQPSQLDNLVENLVKFDPNKIWYIAGGGPYGNFSSKEWKDHLWAWNVSLLTPARILHSFLNNEIKSCTQWIGVGSAIAESQLDINASSYSSAKHGLLGLLKTVKAENPEKDIRLFSPGYMDTMMLPQNAVVRQSQIVANPSNVADTFIKWADLNNVSEWHWRE